MAERLADVAVLCWPDVFAARKEPVTAGELNQFFFFFCPESIIVGLQVTKVLKTKLLI